MATFEEVTDPLVQILTPVPAAGAGICDVCHRAPNAGYQRCYSCSEVMRQVTHPVSLVVPISLYRVGEQLHTVLRGYKDNPVAAVRDRFTQQVGGFLGRFLRDHGECIRAAPPGTWDCIVAVPSGHRRIGPHPLSRAFGLIRGMDVPLLDCLTPSGEVVEHKRASDGAFVASPIVAGLRVLLVDDTYTSGASIQSAGTCLTLAGANVVAAVVIGRVIDPDFNAENALLWKTSVAAGFNFETCCLEG